VLPGLRRARKSRFRGDRITRRREHRAAPANRPSYAEEARALLSERLLDAAEELLADHDWPSVTMADIARGAGVSRQTLYNEFGSRQAFAQAYVLREADRFLGAAEAAIADHADDPEAALQAAFTGFLSSAADNPLVRTIVAGDPGSGLLALVTTRGALVVGAATARLAACFVATWPQLSDRAAHLAAESTVRLAISHALLPTGPADRTGAAVAALLGPNLERLIAEDPAARR
jgi:AcrR family transcriptional regulator